MDQVTKVRKYLKREQWKSLIKECQSSGMTVTAWCALNGICQNLPVPATAPEKTVAFKKLEVMSPFPDTKAAVIIRLPNATVEVNEGAGQQTVQAVLLALQSIC